MLQIWSFAVSKWVSKDFLDSINGRIFGFFKIFFIFGKVYEDFVSNKPLEVTLKSVVIIYFTPSREVIATFS